MSMIFWIVVTLLGSFSLTWLYGTCSQAHFSMIATGDIAWCSFSLFLWVCVNRDSFNPLHVFGLIPGVMAGSSFPMVSGSSRVIYPIGRFLQLGGLALVLIWLTAR